MVYSHDPERYSDSNTMSKTYETTPVALEARLTFPKSNYTYFEMGGDSQAGPSTVTLPRGRLTLVNASSIPSRYRSSTYLDAKWTWDGTAPLTSTTASSLGTFGLFPRTGAGISLLMSHFNLTTGQAQSKAMLVSKNTAILANSTEQSSTISISKITLAAPSISLSVDQIGIVPGSAPTQLPPGARIFYTVNGADPGNAGGLPVTGTPYTNIFPLVGPSGSTVTIRARVYPPANLVSWFEPSNLSTTSFQITWGEPVYVGGRFQRTTGSRNIARLLGDGLVDPAFNVGVGASADSMVGVIRAFGNAGVFVGGDFESVNSVDRVGFIKLNASGGVDTTFDASLSGN
jgi:hypothetical protein